MNLRHLTEKQFAWLQRALFALALLPALRLGLNAALGQLGANPIETLLRATGYWTLVLLLVGLAVTPLRRLSGWQWLARCRRQLGLFAFFYACLHWSCYLVLDQFFDWPAIARDIVKRPYITAGFSAFVLMTPLAATSSARMIKRLGGKNWRNLHRLVYAVAALGVVHFLWLVKKDMSRPLTFATLLAVLLLARLCFALAARKRRGSLQPLANA